MSRFHVEVRTSDLILVNEDLKKLEGQDLLDKLAGQLLTANHGEHKLGYIDYAEYDNHNNVRLYLKNEGVN